MPQEPRPSLVVEALPHLDLVISCQTAESPTDIEWDSYLACVERVSHDGLRCLVLTEGGHPSARQQGRLVALTKGRRRRVAVVSAAPALRFVVSALSLANPHIKTFHPSQELAAFEHIGLTADHHAMVRQRVAALRNKLGLA